MATLERLAARQAPSGPMTRLLSRQPGAREARWMQLLSGPGESSSEAPAESTTRRESGEPNPQERDPGMLARLQELEELVRLLAERVRTLEAGLGVGGE